MSVQTKIYGDLYNLPYILPGLYTQNEKMPSSSQLKKEAVIALWKNIIIEGEGFVGENKSELGEGLKIYLKGRFTLKKIDNFSIFCRQWCKEILPELKIGKADQIERIYTIFQTLGKEYVEADSYGVREHIILLEKAIAISDQLSDQFSISTIISSFHSLFDGFFCSLCSAPWWLPAIRSVFSRYRKMRQSLIGMEAVAATLKDRYSTTFNVEMENKFKAFKDVRAKIARSYTLNGEVVRDNQETLETIKQITSRRLATLALRVAFAVSWFPLCVWPFEGAIGVAMLLGGFIPGLCFILNGWHGALPGACAAMMSMVCKAYYGNPLTFVLCMSVVCLAAAETPLLAFLFFALVLYCFIGYCGILDGWDKDAQTRFYNGPAWPPNDLMNFPLSRLTEVLEYLLEILLRRIDGDSSAVKNG